MGCSASSSFAASHYYYRLAGACSLSVLFPPMIIIIVIPAITSHIDSSSDDRGVEGGFFINRPASPRSPHFWPTLLLQRYPLVASPISPTANPNIAHQVSHDHRCGHLHTLTDLNHVILDRRTGEDILAERATTTRHLGQDDYTILWRHSHHTARHTAGSKLDTGWDDGQRAICRRLIRDIPAPTASFTDHNRDHIWRNTTLSHQPWCGLQHKATDQHRQQAVPPSAQIATASEKPTISTWTSRRAILTAQ